MPSKNDYTKGLSYVAQTPSFLKNFGKPPASPEAGPSGGRAALPERPSDGRWAGGSDDEDEDDEWGTRFGGGGDEGPQVVVLKEGRHLTAEQVKRERKRAAGKASQSPPPTALPDRPPTAAAVSQPPKGPISMSTKGFRSKPNTSKRKLVGAAAGEGEDVKGTKGDGVKKKKKNGKAMLSFDEAEGEE